MEQVHRFDWTLPKNVLLEVPIDESERPFLGLFRLALSEPTHEGRLRAFDLVRHDVTANRLDQLFQSSAYRQMAGPEDYRFLRWVAETASQRHEAAFKLMDVEARFQNATQRKLNIAEIIGLSVFHSVRDREFKGIQVAGGILERVGDEARAASVHGGRDMDTLRELWKTYRGVVHLGMAITYLEDNPDQRWDVFELAEMFRKVLSESCPKGTSKPYVSGAEQIKCLFASRIWGPRYRDRGLPFFQEQR